MRSKARCDNKSTCGELSTLLFRRPFLSRADVAAYPSSLSSLPLGRCREKGLECSYPDGSSNEENESAGPSFSPPQPLDAYSILTVVDLPNVLGTDALVDGPPSLSLFDLGSPSASLASWESNSDMSSSSSGNLSTSLDDPPPLPPLTTNEFLNATYTDKTLRSFGFGSPSPLLPTQTPSGIESTLVASSSDNTLAAPPFLHFPPSSYALQPFPIGASVDSLPTAVSLSWGEMSGLQELQEFGDAFGVAEMEKKDESSIGLVRTPSPPESGHTISTPSSYESFSASFSSPSTSTSASTSNRYSHPPTSLCYTHPTSQPQLQSHHSFSQLTSTSTPLLQSSYLPSSSLPLTTPALVDFPRKQKERQERALESFFETCFRPPVSLVETQLSAYFAPPPLPSCPQTIFERRLARNASSTVGGSGSASSQVGLVFGNGEEVSLFLGEGVTNGKNKEWWEMGRGRTTTGLVDWE